MKAILFREKNYSKINKECPEVSADTLFEMNHPFRTQGNHGYFIKREEAERLTNARLWSIINGYDLFGGYMFDPALIDDNFVEITRL